MSKGKTTTRASAGVSCSREGRSCLLLVFVNDIRRHVSCPHVDLYHHLRVWTTRPRPMALKHLLDEIWILIALELTIDGILATERVRCVRYARYRSRLTICHCRRVVGCITCCPNPLLFGAL
jgi:hypothetical protein